MTVVDSKTINGKRYHRYEYHGNKKMSLLEAEEGAQWFRSRLSRDFRGKVVGTNTQNKRK